jgi:hypothetical protein
MGQRERQRSAFRKDEKSSMAAADEVNDFEFVAVSDGGGDPGRAGDDGAVVFDSDAVGLEGECGEEIVERGAGGELRKAALLAVDEKVHEEQGTGSGDGVSAGRRSIERKVKGDHSGQAG